VLNHNLETVPRLYAAVRPGADYERSLGLLRAAAEARAVAEEIAKKAYWNSSYFGGTYADLRRNHLW
jgi:lipoate synthase